MLAAAVRTDLFILHGRISLLAVLAVGDGFESLDFDLRVLDEVVFLLRPVPAVDDILRDDPADLADLQRDVPEASNLVRCEDKVGPMLKYAASKIKIIKKK